MSQPTSVLPSTASILAELDFDQTQIRLIHPPQQRTHYIAAINWLSKYQSPSAENNLNAVRGLLEAFHHFCTVADYPKASRLLTISLHTPSNEELHNQLYTWGYCQNQIELYQPLLGKLDALCDAIFLTRVISNASLWLNNSAIAPAKPTASSA